MKNQNRVRGKVSKTARKPQPKSAAFRNARAAFLELRRATSTLNDHEGLELAGSLHGLAEGLRASARNGGECRPDEIISEYASNLIYSNQWIKIGLSRAESAILTRLGKDYGLAKSPCASAARLLIRYALVNLPALERSSVAIKKYCEAEGLLIEQYVEARARQTLDSLGVR